MEHAVLEQGLRRVNLSPGVGTVCPVDLDVVLARPVQPIPHVRMHVDDNLLDAFGYAMQGGLVDTKVYVLPVKCSEPRGPVRFAINFPGEFAWKL